MIHLKKGTIEEAIKLSQQIPEFENSYGAATYHERMQNRFSLVLVAFNADKMIGFKAGYALSNKVFYSWMGGVLPEYRQQGVATLLAEKQQNILRKKGFEILRIKTRNKHRAMMQMLLKDSFFITSVETRPNPKENRIILEKKTTTKNQN